MDQRAWISEGLSLLAESGVDAVRVERMADRMGTSKVSFYWHFKDRPDFLNILLATWQQQTCMNMPVRAQPPTWERLRRLFDLPTLGDQSAFGASVEIAIRHWAKSDDLASAAVHDVDARRIAYIGQLLVADGHADSGARAILIYATLLGASVSAAGISDAFKSAHIIAMSDAESLRTQP